MYPGMHHSINREKIVANVTSATFLRVYIEL